MKKLVFFLTLFSFYSSSVLAHGGHDHNDPNAHFVHFFWLAPILVAFIIVNSNIKKRKHFKSFETTKVARQLEDK
ncbi:hypothetical protein [Thalassotalea fusca]